MATFDIGTDVVADDSPETGIAESEIFHILGNDRRRQILFVLERESAPLSVSDLAREVSEEEAGDAEAAEDIYKSVYVSLQQTHLPKLADDDIIDYDREENVVASGPRLDEVAVYVQRSDSPRRFVRSAPLVASVVGLVVVLGAFLEFPLLAAVDVAVWAVGFLMLVAVASVAAHVR